MHIIQKKNPERESHLPVEKIKSMLDKGMRQVDVASAFNVSQSTISRLSGIPHAPVKKTNNTVRLCSCCGQRPIAKGNRFLCRRCYAGQNPEEYTAWDYESPDMELGNLAFMCH